VPHVSVSEIIPASRAEVWSVLSDIAHAGRWNKAWTRIEFTSNQTHGAGTRFRALTESGDDFEFEIATWSAPEHLEVRPLRDTGELRYPVMLESHEFRLNPSESGDETLLELRANASAHGLKGRLIAAFIWPGHQREGLKAALDEISEAVTGIASPVEPTGPSEPLSS